ncbi:MAG: hypothetical protein K9I68_09775 [Bacteroidales bacterium]|nr:hypothetical protein [Bacteroidales bacterium]MCF8338956.1 hypothetical protein [Bacteroidales bacterium]
MNYQLKEVKDAKDGKDFIHLPVKLYKNEKNWIRPLDDDIEKVFDPKRNKFFRNGTATRWLLQDKQGRTVGRIAAFINYNTANKKNDQPTGGIGFFECINDQEAANLLFDTAKDWLSQKDMEAMDGPVNFGDRNENWGLLVEGDYPPNYGMPYHFSYYKDLFENYGFQIYFKQYTYHRKIHSDISVIDDRVYEKAQRIVKDENYHFMHIDKNNFEQYAEEFREIFNKAWAKFVGLGKITQPQAKALIKKLKPIMDPELFWIGYYNKEPVAMFLMLPDLNQIVKHVNGKLDWIGKLKFYYMMKTKKITKAIGTLFGVIPEYQGKGVEAAMVMAFADFVGKKKNFQYTDLEMNWIGDFNPKMMRVAEQVGGKVLKVHHTYRYLFDRNKEFKRMPEH